MWMLLRILGKGPTLVVLARHGADWGSGCILMDCGGVGKGKGKGKGGERTNERYLYFRFGFVDVCLCMYLGRYFWGFQDLMI